MCSVMSLKKNYSKYKGRGQAECGGGRKKEQMSEVKGDVSSSESCT